MFGFIGDRDIEILVFFRWILNLILLIVNVKKIEIDLEYLECGLYLNLYDRCFYKRGGSLIFFG